jgi:hypothetical protein
MHSGLSGGVARVRRCMRGVDPVISLQTSKFDRHFGHEHRRLGVDVPDLVPRRENVHSTAPGISGKKRTAMVTPIQVTRSQITQHDLVFQSFGSGLAQVMFLLHVPSRISVHLLASIK